MSMYLLIANILLINLLIAVFNNIFQEVNSVSHQVWMFQRFTVVMEYQQKPVLPPPLIAFCHMYTFIKYLIRKAKGLQQIRDNGLKLFLEKDDMERLYDFEEECVEGYFHELALEIQQSTEERIKSTDERVENITQKIEDINQKENLQVASVQNIEFRLRKVEEATEQILNHLAVIHRFMSTQTMFQDNIVTGSVGNLPPIIDPRIRTISEASDFAPGRRKFNRSLTEVHADTYIFEETRRFNVNPVTEENEIQAAAAVDVENLIYPTRASIQNLNMTEGRERKYSIQSEDSDFFMPSQRTQVSDTKKPPTLNVRQETETSSESKDTLTPLEPQDDSKTLVGEVLTEPGDDPNFEGLRQRAIRRRNSSMCGARRNSETCSNYDLNRSQTSLHAIPALSKRQISICQSEPDSGNEGVVMRPKLPPKSGKNLLLQIHNEYTSITDELESVCQMIVSPTQSMGGEKPVNELTNPEYAAFVEKQHLKECEDNDYVIMERLLQTRCSIDEEEDFSPDDPSESGHRRMLRRETAIELPITPSKSLSASLTGDGDKIAEYAVKNERQGGAAGGAGRKISPVSSQNSPRNSQYQTYLNPGDNQKLFRKSSESLQKNSSTETDYSHPYKAIKQGSTETNTSINSSFNIDNTSFNNDLSLDYEHSLNTTVIENSAMVDDEKTPLAKRACSLGSSDMRPPKESKLNFLKKQFSIDQGTHRKEVHARPQSEHLEDPNQTGGIVTPPINPGLLSAKLHILQESSSTSTEDNKDEINIPSISTNTVQDEIAKLSSTIKSSTEEDRDPPVNETMC